MINVKFEVMNLKEQIEIIQEFLSLTNQTSQYISSFLGINDAKEIESVVTELYNKRIKDLQTAKKHFQNIWNANCKKINDELMKIFQKEFNIDCIAYVNLNPVWPRYLEERAFDVNVDATDEYLLSSSCHEIVHFIWFEIWNETFPNIAKNEYDYPNLSWLISEIAIEPIFRFSKLKEFSKSNPAYDYFYTEKINNKTVSSIANEIYLKSQGIKDFQQNIYKYFKENKKTCILIK